MKRDREEEEEKVVGSRSNNNNSSSSSNDDDDDDYDSKRSRYEEETEDAPRKKMRFEGGEESDDDDESEDEDESEEEEDDEDNDTWEAIFDKDHQRYYYYNTRTEVTTWERPINAKHIINIEEEEHKSEGEERRGDNYDQEGGSSKVDEIYEHSSENDTTTVLTNMEKTQGTDGGVSDEQSVLPSQTLLSEETFEDIDWDEDDNERPTFLSDAWRKNASISMDGMKRSVDSILEPSALRDVSYLLSQGTKASAVADALVSNFRGLPTCVRTLASWVDATSSSRRRHRNVGRRESPEGTNNDRKSGSAKFTIFNTLKSTLERQFPSGYAADYILRSDKPPSWIEVLVRSERFGSFFVELSKRYPRSLFLSYIVRRVVDFRCSSRRSDGNGTVAAAETSSSSALPADGLKVSSGLYFDSFAKLLTQQLIELGAANTSEKFDAALLRFQTVVCEYGHTHDFALSVLDDLIRSCTTGSEGKRLAPEEAMWWRSVREKLYEHVLERSNGAMAYTLSACLARSSDEAEAEFRKSVVEIWTRVVSKRSADETSCAELWRLYDADIKNVTLRRRCAILQPTLRRIVPILSKLVSNPQETDVFRNKKFREHICRLMALASCLQHGDENNRSESDRPFSFDEKTFQLLMKASAIFTNPNTLHYKLGSPEAIMTTLEPLLISPLVAKMVLLFIRQSWMSEKYQDSAFVQKSCSRTFMELVHRVIEEYPFLQRDAYEILRNRLLARMDEIDDDFVLQTKKNVLTHLAHSLTVPSFGERFGVEVIDFLATNVPNLDQSLLRHWIVKFWGVVKLPFSRDFSASVYRLLNEKKMRHALENCIRSRRGFIGEVKRWRDAYSQSS